MMHQYTKHKRKRILLVVSLLITSCLLSVMVTSSRVDVYEASATIFIEEDAPYSTYRTTDEFLNRVIEKDHQHWENQMKKLRYLLLEDDFLEPHLVQEINLRFQDVHIPPLRLPFLPTLPQTTRALKNVFGIKRTEGREREAFYLQQRELIKTIQQHLCIEERQVNPNSHLSGHLISISYRSPRSSVSQEIVEIVAEQFMEFFMRSKNQEIREILRFLERQYYELQQTVEELDTQLAEFQVTQVETGVEVRLSLLRQRQETQKMMHDLAVEAEIVRLQKHHVLNKKRARREALLESSPHLLSSILSSSHLETITAIDAKEVDREALKRNTSDHPHDINSLQSKQTVPAPPHVSGDVSPKDMIDALLFTDPIYQEYLHQLFQLELTEVSLTVRETHFKERIARYENMLNTMPTLDQSFRLVERKITVYETLLQEVILQLEAAKTAMSLAKTTDRGRIVQRSFSSTLSRMSFYFVLIILWGVFFSCFIGIISLFRILPELIKLKNKRS